jgi:hypothetical protein
MLRVLSISLAVASVDGVVVGILSGHDSAAWTNSSCNDGSLATIKCNLQVYEVAAATAAAKGVELLVYPEGYGLSGNPSKTGFFDAQVSKVGGTPCDTADGNAAPQQKMLSCAAKAHGIALAANIFTELSNHSRRITEIVFDAKGIVVAVHDKIHLAPIVETAIFEPGPFAATTFELFFQRWGILVCYEGVYPWTLGHGDFSEMQGMVDQGATTFVWSIGGMVPPGYFSKKLADKFKVAVVASEVKSIDSPVGAVVDSHGKVLAHTDVSLDLEAIGYTAKAVVNYAELPGKVTPVYT